MRVIKATQQMLETRTLVLGFQGENLRTQLRIDCVATFAEYPNATPALAIKPPSGATYPVFVERDGNEVVWDIVANNLAMKGDGELQLTFYKGDVIAKTSVGHITVNRSLQIDGEMPDVVATWIENANRKLAEVDAQIVELEGMVDTATDAATRAEQSASTASTKAEQAAGSAATATAKANEATNAAGTATAKAAEAEQSAQTATQKATAAADSERIATAKAAEAAQSAQTVAQKAGQITEAAQIATGKAEEASASATAAQTSATNAASSATAASASETAAKASETAASTSATQAAQSVLDAGANAQTAMQKAAEATQSASNAAASATSAATSAETASTKAGEAAQSAQAVAETAEQLADSLEQIDQNTQDIAELDERKANIDGYYPDMTVGNAEQLNSSKYVENSEPYTLRTSGGTSDIGNREYVDAVVGGTLAWNQAVRDEASENSTDFAEIVTVTDAVEDSAGVKVKIEPVQDLHGYDNPWPAGGGKNQIYPPNITFKKWRLDSNVFKTVPDDSTAVIVTVDGENVTIKVATAYFGAGFFVEASSVDRVFSVSESIGGAVQFWSNYAEGATRISTGSTSCSIPANTSGFLALRIDSVSEKTVKVQLESGSTATAWTPYSNICPITGWNGVQVWDDPKHGGLIEWNQVVQNGNFDNGTEGWIGNSSGTSLSAQDGSATAFSQNGAGWFGISQYINVIEGHKYFASCYIKGTPGLPIFDIYAGFVPNSDVRDMYMPADWTRIGNILNCSVPNGNLIGIRMKSGTDVGSESEISVKNFIAVDLTQMLGETKANELYAMERANAGSGVAYFRSLFPADYYPYNEGEVTTVSAVNGDTYRHYSITLPTEAGTVYGGTLDVSTGELVVDMVSIDLGEKIYSKAKQGAAKTIFYTELPNGSRKDSPFGFCSVYKMSTDAAYSVDKTARLYGSSQYNFSRVGIRDSTFDDNDAATFKIAMSGVQLVYELATPITYTLTASQITTLLGTNNVWSDAGQTALTYTGTDEHLTLESGKKYLSRISGTDSMLLGSGQEITAVKGTDNVFDLTKMFGTAVADYVYGQGAAFFRKWFPSTRYPYNAGELRHVDGLQSHEMVGFNQWDEEWEIRGSGVYQHLGSKNKIPVIPGAQYFFNAPVPPSNGITYYKSDGVTRTGTTWYNKGNITIPSDAFYMMFGMSNAYGFIYKHDICINLSHNGSRNGEYEPYEKHSYPLDSSVILRGIPKVGANGVYWDGDRYLPNGTIERRYGVVDLGTQVWGNNTFNGISYFVTNNIIPDLKKPVDSNDDNNFLCTKYPLVKTPGVSTAFVDKTFFVFTSGYIYIRDSSFADLASFRAAMQGVLLVYELAEPTTETAQPYHSTQWVSDWGTEEFVSTGIVPVGHETRYPANLRDKLQHLPDAASGNGSYLITQNDGQMVLTPFPAPPSTAGNYVLKATVTGGVATYTWEVAT